MLQVGLLLLYHHKDLIDDCAQLLNSEWPRSMVARSHSLDKSGEFPPCSLVLLDNGKVVGHSRLCQVETEEDSCYIESVVISKERRGEKLGRFLMEETEKYAKRLGYMRCCLKTRDKKDFYAHLGYKVCAPVIASTTCISQSLSLTKRRLFAKSGVSVCGAGIADALEVDAANEKYNVSLPPPSQPTAPQLSPAPTQPLPTQPLLPQLSPTQPLPTQLSLPQLSPSQLSPAPTQPPSTATVTRPSPPQPPQPPTKPSPVLQNKEEWMSKQLAC